MGKLADALRGMFQVQASEEEIETWDFSSEEIEAKVLTTDTRNALPDSAFALIQKGDGKTRRWFPIHDCAHAQNALSRLSGAKDLSEDERATIKRKAQAAVNKLCSVKGEETVDELQELKDKLNQALADLQAAKDENTALVQAKAEGEQRLVEKEGELALSCSERDALTQEVTQAKRETVIAKRTLALGYVPEEGEMKVIASMEEDAFELFRKVAQKKDTFDRAHLEQEKVTEPDGLILG